ncbi:MAG: hypothetical protein IJ205_08360 [Bacteroidales bacterium]|nr:hypothetical protein [Bacteroidales bacterium]
MKKNLFFIASTIFMVLAVTNCSKEIIDPSNDNDIQKGSSFELIATPVETRTENDGMNTKWVSGDAINVFHAEEETTNYVSDGEFIITDVSTNRFQGTVSETLEADKKYDWYMFYPYSSHITTPANTNAGYTVVGSRNNGNQTQAGNNNKAHIAGPNYPLIGVLPSVASTEVPKVSVNQVCSFIEFNVKNTSSEDLVVKSIVFTATEDIVGTYYINFIDPENVVFTPSTNDDGTYTYASEKAVLNVTDGETIANGNSAAFYIGIKPFSVSSGTLKVAVNGYEKEINITKSTSFSAGKIKKINFDYNKEAEVLPVYDNTSADYSTGFEDGFTAGTAYNNTLEKLDGPENEQWASYYGTVSTSSKLNGNNSMQMRWYTSAAKNLGYARTNFKVAKVGSVSFSAAATNNLNLSLFYMTEKDEDWVLAQTFTLTSTSKQYSYEFSSPIENAQLKFQIALPATNPSSNSNVRIDDVVVSKDVPVVELASIAITKNPTKTTYTLGEEFVFDGEVTATYSDGSTVVVTDDIESDGATVVATVGVDKTVTISYTDGEITKTSTYEITVNDPDASYIEVPSQTITFSELGYDNGAEVSQVDGTNCGINFNKGTNSNTPKYYTSGNAVRAYGGNFFIVTVEEGYQISSIELTFGSSDGSNAITTDKGTYSDGKWTGSVQNGGSVTFTIGGTTGNRRISSIKIN